MTVGMPNRRILPCLLYTSSLAGLPFEVTSVQKKKGTESPRQLYDLQGRSVARAEAGLHTFRLAPAVYLVRVAGKRCV